MENYHLFKIVRTLQNIKQVHIAAKVGIKQQSLVPYESGIAKLSDKTLSKIAPLLNLNPAYLVGESSNPFKCNDLIKFRLPDGMGGIDYSIIYFIAEHNKYLNLIYFTSMSPRYAKFAANTLYEYPVCAVAIRDDSDNIFLIKRKADKPLTGEKELDAKLSAIAKGRGITIEKAHINLLAGEENAITDMAATKEEIDAYFAKSFSQQAQLKWRMITDEEWELIQKNRQLKK